LAARAKIVDGAANVADDGTQGLDRNRPAVDDEALGDVDEMRRGEARRSMSGGAQRRVDHRRDRALAVRAGDVDRSKRALGVTEARHERGDVLEAELDPELFEAEEIGERIQSALRRG